MVMDRKKPVRAETFCFLSEEVSTPEDQNWKPGCYTVEAKNIGGTNESILSVKYHGCMQTFGDINFNKRIYEGDDVWSAYSNDHHAQKKARMGKLTMELGHPAAEIDGTEFTFLRLCEVPKERSCGYIRNLALVGKRMEADIQTDPGTQDFGVNVAKSIIGAGYIPSHSLRSFGVIRPGTTTRACKGIVNVRKFVTYDMVESPSHDQADAMFRPKGDTMKGAYKQTFESTKPVIDDFGGIMIPYVALAQYAMQESAQSYLMEAFQITDADMFGVTSTGNSIVLRQDKDVFYIPTTESVKQEIGSVLKNSISRLF